MSQRQELAGLVALQKLLDRRHALQKQRKTPPAELASLRRRTSERDSLQSENESRGKTLREEQRVLEGDVSALYEERDHFRKQKAQVTNMRQLTAVVSALDHVDTQLKEKEGRYDQVTRELEGIEAELSRLLEETPEEKEAREAAERVWEAQRAELEKELAAVDAEIRGLQKQIPNEAIRSFKKVWEVRKPQAMVPIDGEACSVCHAELRPALLQLVRAGETLEQCEVCRRFLYDPDTVTAAP